MFDSLRTNLSFIRFLQLLTVLGLGLAGFLFTTIAHSWWIFVTVLVISAAFEPGLLVQKSINRGKGTIAAFIFFIPLIYLLHFNYRLIPLTLILISCAMWLPTAKRYDLTVIFITLQVFLTTAYSFTSPIIEGPFEVVLNRGICTIIGILICLCSDYILFAKFNYSKKVYFLLQHELCTMLMQKLEKILHAQQTKSNKYLLVDDLRHSLNHKFLEISSCHESLLHDFRTDFSSKIKILEFQKLLFKLRKELFAIYYCACVLKDHNQIAMHLEHFEGYLVQAKNNYLTMD